MSQSEPTPDDSLQEISLVDEQERVKQSVKVLVLLVERAAPWLVDFGSWIFGGLIAFTLLVMAALFPIGPVDPAIIVATTAFALALPPDIAGLVLLRLNQDLARIRYEDEVTQAFQEVGFTAGVEVPTPESLKAQRKRRTEIVLSCSLGILALSALLTLTGLTATLWHMAWWIAVAFLAMVMISLGVVIVALVASRPPEAAEEKERKRRYRKEIIRQARAQNKKKG
jgi:hypothetical protein